MPENLAKFLGKDKFIHDLNKEATGSFVCQECLEVVHSAVIDEDENVMYWICKDNHKSQVRI
jgi:hypothetical protein